MTTSQNNAVKRDAPAPPHIPLAIMGAYGIIQLLLALWFPYCFLFFLLWPITMVAYIATHVLLRFVTLRLLVGQPPRLDMSLRRLYMSVPGAPLSRRRFALSYLLPDTIHAVLLIALTLLLPKELRGVTVAVLILHIFVLAVVSGWLTVLLKGRRGVLLTEAAGRVSLRSPVAEGIGDAPDASSEATPMLTDGANDSASAPADAPKEQRFYPVLYVLAILFFFVVAALFAFLLWESGLGLKFPVLHIVLLQPALWAVLISLAALVFCVVSLYRKQSEGTLHLLFIALFGVPSLFMVSLLGLFYGGESRTDNIKHYGVFDTYVAADVVDFLPEKITDDMTPIQYSYRFYYSMDITYEIYLEVKLTESAYETWREQYRESLVDFPYEEGIREAVLTNDRFDIDRVERCIQSPKLRKILFSDAEHTLIFVVMWGGDPIYFKDSAYVQRFPAVVSEPQSE